MLKILYVAAIGILFAALVGLGFQAFYPQPKYPEYPADIKYGYSATPTTEQRIAQDRFDAESKAFQKTLESYNRNLSVGLIIIAILTLIISMLGIGKIEVIGDSLTLGGVLTLFYGLTRALMAGDEKIRFLAVALGFVLLTGLAYWKFVRKEKNIGSGA